MEFKQFDEYCKENGVETKPRLKEVQDDLLPMLKEQFLRFFRQTGSIKEAAESMGLQQGHALKWRKEDKKFADEMDDIRYHELLPMVEEAAFQRALSGKSDLMLMFLMKSYKPDQYDEKMRQPLAPPPMVLQIVDAKGQQLKQSNVVDAEFKDSK
jgi:hypothetical protein